MTALVPVDAEALVVAYLAEVMPDWTVGTTVSGRSGFLKVTQLGGDRRGHVHDFPMIAIQAWDEDETAASRGCREAFAHLWGMGENEPHGHLVRETIVIGAPQSFPDPDSSCPRYQATVQLNVRPVPLGAHA